MSLEQDFLGWAGSGKRDFITVTNDGSLFTGTSNLHNLVDGDLGANSGGAAFWNPQSAAGKSLTFDLKAPVVLKQFRWRQDTSNSHGTFKLQGSNDNSTYTDIGSSFTLGGAATSTYDVSANTTAYRYIRLLGVSGTTSGTPWLIEAEFETEHSSYEAGDRTGSLGISQTGLTANGSSVLGNLIDGADTANDTDSYRVNSGVTIDNTKILCEIDFGGEVDLRAFAWLNDGVNAGTWQAQVEVAGVWQNFGSSFTLGSATGVAYPDTEVRCEKFRLQGVSGTTVANYQNELRFNLDEVGGGGGSFGTQPVLFITM